MKLIFWSYNDPELHEAWTKHLSKFDFVEIKQGDILSEPVDIVVSPANSFGFMDGGIDLHYKKHFGEDLEYRVKREIYNYWDGELRVGQSCSVPTMNKEIPWIMIVPTMRTPTILTPSSPNIYYAAQQIIKSARDGKSIAVPGLGTGVGKMPADICAQHVKIAIERELSEETWYPTCFTDAKLPGDERRTMHDFLPLF